MSWFPSFRSLFFNPPKTQSNILRAFSNSLVSHQELSENPYFEKYAEKIAKVQKGPDDIQARLKKNLDTIQAHTCVTNKHITPEHLEQKNAKSHQPKIKKDLHQIMKLDIVQDKSAEDIESIWKQYHEIKDGVYAVLPGESFTKMQFNLKEYPSFLFPLPRAEGYEFIVCQFLGNSCYFTSLINFQAFNENAPVCLTVTYYTEFQADKGIVLMRGEYDNTVLKAHEAQCLTNQLQLYYGSDDKERLRLVHNFNKNPQSFKHMDLISNFELSLGKFTVTN